MMRKAAADEAGGVTVWRAHIRTIQSVRPV